MGDYLAVNARVCAFDWLSRRMCDRVKVTARAWKVQQRATEWDRLRERERERETERERQRERERERDRETERETERERGREREGEGILRWALKAVSTVTYMTVYISRRLSLFPAYREPCWPQSSERVNYFWFTCCVETIWQTLSCIGGRWPTGHICYKIRRRKSAMKSQFVIFDFMLLWWNFKINTANS